MSRHETEPEKKGGYGNPPVESQFPDNPARQRGRRRGSKNKPKVPTGLTPSELVALEEARRIVRKEDNLDAIRTVNRAQIKTAVQGGTNAQKAVLARHDAIERKQREAEDAALASAEAYVRRCEELLSDADTDEREELERHMLPHPADIEVDFAKREVRVLGPATTMERRQWNRMLDLLAKYRSAIVGLRRQVEQSPEDIKKQLAFDIYNHRYLGYCEKLPERYRPKPLFKWEALPDIKWYELADLLPVRKRRRLVKNATLLEGQG